MALPSAWSTAALTSPRSGRGLPVAALSGTAAEAACVPQPPQSGTASSAAAAEVRSCLLEPP